MSRKPRAIYIGWDPREAPAFMVACASARANLISPVPIRGLVLEELQAAGLYRRPTRRSMGKLIDELSIRPDYNGALSTEFANSRFLVPELVRRSHKRPPYGWALFMDCDQMPRANLDRPFLEIEFSDKAVYCVHHQYAPPAGEKMDGQTQTRYGRKNWSSFMFFNCDHPANARLTPELVNSVPGADLHRFCWLEDNEIGELDEAWNFLPGHSPAEIEPNNVHWTEGGPWFEAFRDVPYADEWRAWLNRAAAKGLC